MTEENKSWFRRHKILTTILAIPLMLIIILGLWVFVLVCINLANPTAQQTNSQVNPSVSEASHQNIQSQQIQEQQNSETQIPIQTQIQQEPQNSQSNISDNKIDNPLANISLSTSTTTYETTPDNTSSSDTSSEDFCSLTNLKAIIPDKLDCLICSANENCTNVTNWDGNLAGSCYARSNIDYSWLDGTKMTFQGFNKASKAGQNINYLYSNGRLFYSKIPISSDGTIGERIKYEIDLAIDPTNVASDGYEVKMYRCCSDYCLYEDYNNFN